MSKLYKGLKKGLEEVLANKEGKITLRAYDIEVPQPPKEYGPKDIKKIRYK